MAVFNLAAEDREKVEEIFDELRAFLAIFGENKVPLRLVAEALLEHAANAFSSLKTPPTIGEFAGDAVDRYIAGLRQSEEFWRQEKAKTHQ